MRLDKFFIELGLVVLNALAIFCALAAPLNIILAEIPPLKVVNLAITSFVIAICICVNRNVKD